MEKPVIFLQSLMLLVLTIQIISACKCDKPGTLMESICANQSLVMATALEYGLYDMAGNKVDDSCSAVRAEYYMQLTTVYSKGKKQFLEHSFFVLITTIEEMECGVVLELEKDYFIAGTLGTEHALNVNSCDYLEQVAWDDLSHKEFEIKNDLLNQQSKIIC